MTFMSIVTGKMQPDEGKVEWLQVRDGLDRYLVLEEGTNGSRCERFLMSCSQLKLASMTSIWPWRRGSRCWCSDGRGWRTPRASRKPWFLYLWMPRSMKWRVLLGLWILAWTMDVTSCQGGPRSLQTLLEKTRYPSGRANYWMQSYRLAQTLLQNYENALSYFPRHFLEWCDHYCSLCKNQQLTHGRLLPISEVYEEIAIGSGLWAKKSCWFKRFCSPQAWLHGIWPCLSEEAGQDANSLS